MRSLMRRDLHDDRGSLILALLGIVILTTVASVGLAAVVNGQKQTRHDNTFAQSLDNANSGLDAMVAAIKNNGPAADIKQTLLDTTMYKNVSATPSYTYDSTGNPAATTWRLSSTGIATTQGHTIYRTVTETVTIAHTYRTPVYGANGLALGAGSGINDYDPGSSTENVTEGNTTLPGAVSLSTTVAQPTTTTPGAATAGACGAPGSTDSNGTTAGNGCLQVSGTDAQNFSQIVNDSSSAPGATSNTCTAPTGSTTSACGSSTIVNSTAPQPTITTPCTPNSSVGIDGHTILSLPTAGILGLTVGTNLETQNLLASPLDVCSTAFPIVIPSLTALLAGTPLPLIGFPISNCTTGLQVFSGSTLVSETEACTPPPSPLLGIYSTAGQPILIGTAGQTTVLDAIVADPSGNCQINGNVVLYGVINCNTITIGPGGGSLQVFYPNTLTAFSDVSHVDYVDNWNETHG